MSKMNPAVKGLLISVPIFVALVGGTLVARESGILDRIGPIAGGAAPAETPGPDTIPEGTWTVGDDIQPGTYRTAAAVRADAGCYWAVYRTGSNTRDIVANDIPDGGRPTVVLNVGQDFYSHDCGTWVRENPTATAPAGTNVAGSNSIPEGMWTVGKDVAPGTYRVAAAVDPGANCYWAIYKSGTNARDVLAADIPAGGRPSVTLEVGHDFASSNCGTWVKEE